MVRILLERGARIERKDGGGSTPLIFAASKGHVEVVKILLEKGANKHGVIPKIEEKSSDPTHHRTEILRLLSDE